MDLTDRVSGTKARTLIFGGGSSDQDGATGGDPFALAIKRIEDQPGLRRMLALLRQIPLRLASAASSARTLASGRQI